MESKKGAIAPFFDDYIDKTQSILYYLYTTNESTSSP